jgi:hypothetical protein
MGRKNLQSILYFILPKIVYTAQLPLPPRTSTLLLLFIFIFTQMGDYTVYSLSDKSPYLHCQGSIHTLQNMFTALLLCEILKFTYVETILNKFFYRNFWIKNIFDNKSRDFAVDNLRQTDFTLFYKSTSFINKMITNF